MATIDECIEFALKNIGLWWRYGISRHCDEWKYIIIGRIFESEIILIPPSLKISESSSNGSYRNTDEVWWRYGISRSCDECSWIVTSGGKLGPCKVRNETETKRNAKKQNKICKLRNETKLDHSMDSKKKQNHSWTSAAIQAICSSISKKLYFVIDDAFYIYAMYLLRQKSCTLPNKKKTLSDTL